MIFEKTVNISYLVEVTLKLILLMLWLFPTFDIVEFHLKKKPFRLDFEHCHFFLFRKHVVELLI